MPQITTTRIGLTAVVASLATALAGPGGAAAISTPVVQPVATPTAIGLAKKDAGTFTSAVRKDAESIKKKAADAAPNTRRALVKTVAKTQRTAETTVMDLSDTARTVTTSAKRTADASVARAVVAGKRAVDSAGRTATSVKRGAESSVALRTARARALARSLGKQIATVLSGRRFVMAVPRLGQWSLTYSRTDDGCVRVDHLAPMPFQNPKLAPRKHLGLDADGYRIGLVQDGGRTSAEAGC